MRCRDWLWLTCLMVSVVCCLSAKADPRRQATQPNNRTLQAGARGKKIAHRVSRPAKRRHHRPHGFYPLLTEFIRDTVNDTGVAYRNASRVVATEFPALVGRTTTPAPQTDNSTTNATTMAPITMRQVFSFLGRNYRGLAQLFDMEWHKALNDSHYNVLHFRKELHEAIRPFLRPTTTTTTTTTTEATTTAAS